MQSQTIQSCVFELSYHPDERLEKFRSLTLNQKVAVLDNLSRHVQFELLRDLTDQEIAELMKQFEADDATDLLQILTKQRRQTVMKLLPEKFARTILMLLQFDPDTAAGMMSVDYILLDESTKISAVTDRVSSYERRTGKLPTLLVINDGKIRGYLPASKLFSAHKGDKVKFYTKKVPTIISTADYESVIHHFHEHPQSKSVVVDPNQNILGVIYSDDVLDFMQEQQGSSLYDFAGVNEEETVFDSIWKKVTSRYKWLIINLGTAFLASAVVRFFDQTIAKYVLLAVYMPIVAGMGGNAATQTLAILVRGITLKQVDLTNCLPLLKKEMGAAAVNGVINGLIVAAAVYVFNHDAKVAIVLAVAMVANLLVASFFGTLVPLVMKFLGKDPATSATIFITTATDVLGFTAFLGLASIVLR